VWVGSWPAEEWMTLIPFSHHVVEEIVVLLQQVMMYCN